MAQSGGWKNWYRRWSGKMLDLVVTPHLVGDVPRLQAAPPADPTSAPAVAATASTVAPADPPGSAPNSTATGQPAPAMAPPVCYVLLDYSRSNALLVDNETRRRHLPPVLDPMDSPLLHEANSVLFLRRARGGSAASLYSPKLMSLLEAMAKNPGLDVTLVPVTVLWGREPDKEDNWFKLLLSDHWNTPSIVGQIKNMGVHGRNTLVQFHEPLSLRALMNDTPATQDIPTHVNGWLRSYLEHQRELVVGPDLSDRRNLVDALLDSPGIQQAIHAESIRANQQPAQVRRTARDYLDEIVADYSATTTRMFEQSLHWLWTQLYDGVDVHNFATVREMAEDHELIYVPCHRSHIDYLLLSYVIYRQGLRTPYIAAGDNLNLPVLGNILRGGGAFFIRRSFRGNHLYTAVIREYLHSVLVRNTPLEYFIEGGRSRTGRLLSPKTGMLAMTLHSYLRDRSKPIAFVPTYFGYERLMEGGTYIGELEGKPKESESILGLLKTTRKIERIFGKVHVNFGEPILLDTLLRAYGVDHVRLQRNDDELPAEVSAAIGPLAQQIMQNINRAAVINPVSLLALVLLAAPKHALDEAMCVQQLDVYRQMALDTPYDERVQVTPLTGRDIIAYGLKLKLIKRVGHLLGDLIAIEAQQAVLLTYFRNNILHLFILPSLLAALILQNGRISHEEASRIIGELYPFLQAELFLKWPLEQLETRIVEHIDSLSRLDLIENDGHTLFCPLPNSAAFTQLRVLAAPVQLSLERYFMTVTLIHSQGSGRISTRQLEDLSHLLGQRLSILYEFNSPEFFDKGLFKRFIETLTQRGYLTLSSSGLIDFDDRLATMAADASLVLDADKLNTLRHLASISDSDVEAAMLALERKAKKRKPR